MIPSSNIQFHFDATGRHCDFCAFIANEKQGEYMTAVSKTAKLNHCCSMSIALSLTTFGECTRYASNNGSKAIFAERKHWSFIEEVAAVSPVPLPNPRCQWCNTPRRPEEQLLPYSRISSYIPGNISSYISLCCTSYFQPYLL